MNQLVSRLALAMMAIAVLTVLVITASQQLAFQWEFRSLPPEIQERITQRREREESANGRIAENFRRSRRVQQRFLLGGTAVAAILAGIIAIVYARTISKPIERVSSASAKLAQGDLSTRILERSAYSSLEARALTDNFNQMASALEGYEAERRDMIASIAHDLRTPLTAMQLRLEALREELVPLNQDEVRLLISQTELLERLITDLRTLSLADAGKLSLQKQETEIYNLTELVIQTYKQRAQQKNIAIDVQASQPLVANVDPARLKQILSNLLDNALRVSPEHSKIVMKLERTHDTLSIVIEDEGPGIPEKLITHIFERYMQNKDTSGSSGLGLAIVATLVDLHGGSVSACNRVNGGAQFLLQLPA